jgi:hypothetical protein
VRWVWPAVFLNSLLAPLTFLVARLLPTETSLGWLIGAGILILAVSIAGQWVGLAVRLYPLRNRYERALVGPLLEKLLREVRTDLGVNVRVRANVMKRKRELFRHGVNPFLRIDYSEGDYPDRERETD